MDNETVNNIKIGEKIRKWRKLKKDNTDRTRS